MPAELVRSSAGRPKTCYLSLLLASHMERNSASVQVATPMKQKAPTLIQLCFIILSIFVGVVTAFANPTGPRPLLRQDLHKLGFPDTSVASNMANYTDVVFLSDDLVLVALNFREFASVSPLFADEPPATFLLFDVSLGKLVRSIELRVEKAQGSVRSTQEGHFALLDEAGVRLCSSDLTCGRPFASRGPLFASTGGTRLIAGGNVRSEQKLLDSATLNELDRSHSPEYLLEFGGGIWPSARFLSDKIVAKFSFHKLVVAKLDGAILYRLPVKITWDAGLVTAASGARFCIHEIGYTRWNSFKNLGYVEGIPPSIESIRVMDTESGKLVFQLKWDPRPYGAVVPALSPNAHRIAILRGGFLEVYEIP
jgi:hypothetical protein